MPALTVFGGYRIGLVAGDDLRKLSLLAALLRLLQVAALIPAAIFLAQAKHDFDYDNVSKECKSDRRREQRILVAFLAASASTVVLSLLLESFIFQVSSRGSPVQTEKRQALQWLCAIKLLPLTALNIAALLLGLTSLTILERFCRPSLELAVDCFPDTTQNDLQGVQWCPKSTMTVVSIVAVSHMIEVAIVGMVLLRLFCQRTTPFRWVLLCLKNWNLLRTNDRTSSWQCCCRVCCGVSSVLTCCLCGGQQATVSGSSSSYLSEIASILADYFEGSKDVDVTPSDLLMGIHVLSLEQKKERQKLVVSLWKEKERQEAHDVERGQLIKSQSMVAGSFDVSNSPMEESESLSYSESPTNQRRRSSVQQLRLQRTDTNSMAHFCLTERPTLLPRNPVDSNAILEGARYSKLALAIYGHMMYVVQDKSCLAPITLTAASLRRCFCKKKNSDIRVVADNICGCNSAAFDLFADLDDGMQVLFCNFTVGIGKCPYAIVADKRRNTLVIVIRGTFSLEAVVTDLSLQPVLLSKYGDECEAFQNLNEYCHRGFLESALWIYRDLQERGILEQLVGEPSAPYHGYRMLVAGHSLGAGCAAILAVILHPTFEQLQCLCFSPPGCVFSKTLAAQSYIRTYVVDSDIVPRLSLHSVEGLRMDVLETIARIKVPKHCVAVTAEASTTLVLHEQIPDSPFYQRVQAFREHQQELSDRRSDEKLYLPGQKVVYMVPQQQDPHSFLEKHLLRQKPRKRYTPAWADAEHFREIQVVRTVMNDHDPQNMSNILNQLAESFRSGSVFEPQ